MGRYLPTHTFAVFTQIAFPHDAAAFVATFARNSSRLWQHTYFGFVAVSPMLYFTRFRERNRIEALNNAIMQTYTTNRHHNHTKDQQQNTVLGEKCILQVVHGTISS